MSDPTPKLSKKELQARVDKLEEIVEGYKASLFAKHQDLAAAQSKIKDLEERLKILQSQSQSGKVAP